MARSTSPPLHALPPPPDVESTSTDGPVLFMAQGFGREIACIGANPAGEINPQPWGKVRRACWRCTLFPGGLLFRADSIARARIALLYRIADWHDLSGGAYAQQAKRIRMQADEMRLR